MILIEYRLSIITTINIITIITIITIIIDYWLLRLMIIIIVVVCKYIYHCLMTFHDCEGDNR